MLGQVARTLEHIFAPVGPGLNQALHDAFESGPSVTVLGREVRAAIKWFAIRGQKDRHRPAARAGHDLHSVHVDAIDIRAFLAVHFDRHEMRVHQYGNLEVLETLAFHDVTPMTGAVTNREQNRFVLEPSLLEGRLAPRKPLHGVVRVLEQVRTGLERQGVRGMLVITHARTLPRREERGK